MFETPDDGDAPVPNFEHQVKCPNSRNLIAIIGDSLADPDRECDHKCNLLMEGLGRKPKDVMIVGDRLKKDVIRADRADGFYLRNVWVEQGAFNDVDVVETNGFRLRELVTPYAQNYGVLTFASDHGLYEHIEAYGNGDSGIYPGSGPEGHCKRYGIEIRYVNSHDNVLGYSGTAGNGTWTHNSKFHHNNAGISDDSFASGHPGHAAGLLEVGRQRRSTRTTRTTSPNDRDNYCKNTPFEKRRSEIVCPQFQVPVGSGFILYGVNENLISNNSIYDNWRSGVRLFWVPASSAARTTRPSSSTPRTATSSSTTRWASTPAARAAERRRLLLGRAGHRQLLGRQRGARRQGHERPGDAAGVPAGLHAPERQRDEARRRRRRARPGTRATTLTRPAAPGSRPRRGLRNEVGAGGHRPARRRSGRTAARWGTATAGTTQAATDTARLQWKEKPSLILVPELPRDRILTGQLRNASLRAVDLDSRARRDPRCRRGTACGPPRCSPRASRTGSTRGR